MSPSRVARPPSTMPTGCWPTAAAATAACPTIRLDQIVEQLALGVDRVMAEGSLYDKRAGGAGHRAGARRPDRGDLPGARLPHDAAALRLYQAGRHGGHAGRAPRVGDLQGSARRPDARPDLRLHAPPARSRTADGRATSPSREQRDDGAPSRCRAYPTSSAARG